MRLIASKTCTIELTDDARSLLDNPRLIRAYAEGRGLFDLLSKTAGVQSATLLLSTEEAVEYLAEQLNEEDVSRLIARTPQVMRGYRLDDLVITVSKEVGRRRIVNGEE